MLPTVPLNEHMSHLELLRYFFNDFSISVLVERIKFYMPLLLMQLLQKVVIHQRYHPSWTFFWTASEPTEPSKESANHF